MPIYAIGYSRNNLIAVCRKIVMKDASFQELITEITFNFLIEDTSRDMFTIYSSREYAMRDIDEIIKRSSEIKFNNLDMISTLLDSADEYDPTKLLVFEYCLKK